MWFIPGVPVHRKGRCQESDITAGFARFCGLLFLAATLIATFGGFFNERALPWTDESPAPKTL
jgi:hypothetical protein